MPNDSIDETATGSRHFTVALAQCLSEMSDTNHPRHRLNVIGPFYVEDGCCTVCGVPDTLAPELFGGSDDHCYVKRQPQTPAEIDAMLHVMVSQELGCIRYAGSEDALLRRLAENGEAGLCDVTPPRDAGELRRDHVVFVAKPDAEPWTPRRLLERLVVFAARWRTTAIFDDGTMATISVSWFQDNYHRIEALVSSRPGEWLVRHHGPPRLGDILHEWLTSDPSFNSVRWQTRAEWEARGPSRPKPW